MVENETNNSSQTANPLASGSTVDAQLATSTDVDYFRIDASGASVLSLSFDPPDFSGHAFSFSVEDATGRVLASISSAADPTPVSVGLAAAGAYYVRVSAYDALNHTSNPYRLTAVVAAGGAAGYESEGNDSRTLADPLATGNSIRGQLDAATDIDYFAINVDAAGVLRLDLEAAYYFSHTYREYTVALENAQGVQVESYNLNWYQQGFEAALVAPGAYFVRVSAPIPAAFLPGDDSPYRLSAAFTTGGVEGFELEGNDTRQTASTLAPNANIRGRLVDSADIDFYSVTVGTAGVLGLSFDRPDGFFANAYSIRVENGAGDLLYATLEGTDPQPLVLGLESAGTYFVRIAASSFASPQSIAGTYSLTSTFTSDGTAAYESEPNGTRASADTLALGATINGQLASAADLDYFAVTVGAAGVLTLGLNRADSITLGGQYLVSVEDAGGTTLAAYFDSLDPLAISVGIAAAGTYHVRVSGSATPNPPAVSTPYALTAGFTVGPVAGYESEGNDSRAAADALAIGSSIHGQLAAGADIDTYAVTTSAGGVLTFTMAGAQGLAVSVEDAAGTLLGRFIDLFGPRSFSVGAAEAGTYFVSIGARTEGGAASSDAYDLSVAFANGGAAAYESEANDTRAGADVISAANPVSGVLATPSDVDYYAISVGTAGVLSVSFDAPANFGFGLGGFTLGVENAAGVVLANFNDNSAGPGTFRAGISEAGTYYVRVAGGYYGTTAGYAYGLNAQFGAGGAQGYESEPNDTRAGADDLGLGAMMTGQLGSATDVDIYRFSPADSGTYSVVFSPQSYPMSYGLQDSAGHAIALSAPEQGGAYRFAASAGETYYAVIAEREGVTGIFPSDPYTLVVVRDDYGDTAATAGQIAIGNQLDGNIQWAGDHDWLQVSLQSGVRYQVSLTGAGTGNLTLADPHLDVFNADGQLITSNNDFGNGKDARLTFTATADGTYFIDASGAAAATGSYKLALIASPDDYRASPGTTATLTPGLTLSGQVEVGDDQDWFRVDLQAGSAYRFDMQFTSQVADNLDPRLTLFNSQGVALADDFDGNGDPDVDRGDAQLVYIARETGTYFLAARGENATTGAYSVSATALAADYYTAALLENPASRWNTGQPLGSHASITYSFPTAPPSPFSPGDFDAFAAFNTAQQAAIRQILAHISQAVGITFTETAGESGNIRFMTEDFGGTFIEALTIPYLQGAQFTGADIVLDNSLAQNATPVESDFAYRALIHEVGHALGLKHPGDYDGIAGHGTPPFLPAVQDSDQYTVMSYFTEPAGNAADLMVFDLAALQLLYGANGGTRSGDDVYTFSANGQRTTLWDSGGYDRLDASTSSGPVTLDLAPGAQSYSGTLGTASEATPQIGIAFGVTIENARGGGGADLLLGNSANNLLEGGQGNDTLVGGNGDDILIGGAGIDSLDGGSGNDTLDYSTAPNYATVVAELWRGKALNNGEGGVEFFSSIENLTGGAGSDLLSGDFRANRVEGNGGADNMFGQEGDDTLAGGAGNDTLNGGSGSDTLDYGAVSTNLIAELWAGTVGNDGSGGIDIFFAMENLDGGSGNDFLAGNYAANRIAGGAGNDRVYAYEGDDQLAGGAGNDTLVGGSGSDTLDYSAVSVALTAELWAGSVANDGSGGADVFFDIENLRGGTGGDFLAGNFAANRIEGGAGNDRLYGYESDDTLAGGAGADTLVGGSGSDTLDYSAVTGDLVAELWRGSVLNDGFGTTDSVFSMEHLAGGSGDDLLSGDFNPNRVTGNAGNDRIFGQEGNDTLAGGLGNDSLNGGAGADQFVFDALLNAATNTDMVGDFSAAQGDKLVLDHLIFGALAAGSLAAGTLVSAAGATAQDGNDFLLYNTSTGALSYDADGNGAGTAVQFAILSGHPALAAGDFSIV